MSVEVWAGPVSIDDVAAHVAALASETAWGSGGRILTDVSALEEGSRPAGDQIAELVALFRQRLTGRTSAVQWAIIANAAFDDATRFAEGIGEDARRLIVFSTLVPACTWLGVDASRMVAVLGQLRSEALQGA